MSSGAPRSSASSRSAGKRNLEPHLWRPQPPSSIGVVQERTHRERQRASDQDAARRARSARPRQPGSPPHAMKFDRASRLIHPAPQRRGSGRRRTRRHIPFPCLPGTASLARFTAPTPAPRCRTAKEAGPFCASGGRYRPASSGNEARLTTGCQVSRATNAVGGRASAAADTGTADGIGVTMDAQG